MPLAIIPLLAFSSFPLHDLYPAPATADVRQLMCNKQVVRRLKRTFIIHRCPGSAT
jgi:hypothetical protein